MNYARFRKRLPFSQELWDDCEIYRMYLAEYFERRIFPPPWIERKPMKKIEFDFSRFGCNREAVQELIEAMGFDTGSKEVIARPGDIVLTATGEKRTVVTGKTYRRMNNSTNSLFNKLPVMGEEGEAWISDLNYYRLNGKTVTKFEDDE